MENSSSPVYYGYVAVFDINAKYYVGDMVKYMGVTYIANSDVDEEYPDKSSSWSSLVSEEDMRELDRLLGFNPISITQDYSNITWGISNSINTAATQNFADVDSLRQEVAELRAQVKKLAEIILRNNSDKEIERRKISVR